MAPEFEYIRVEPRDLFNAAKLLKCLGQLYLKCGDDPRIILENIAPTQDYRFGHLLDQEPSDGSIYCTTIAITLADGQRVCVFSPLNSRKAYPIQFDAGHETGDVFTDGGELSEEFLKLLDDHDPRPKEDAT